MDTRTIGSAELESLTDQHLARIKQIDRILEGPVRWLIDEATVARARKEPLPRFHNWISWVAPTNRQSSRVATSLSLVTLQRLNLMRRRFPGLKKEFEGLDQTLNALGECYLPKRNGSDADYFRACWQLLESGLLGALNPFSASQVFRLLMERGEAHAHSGSGCLAFFAMVWPLHRVNEEDRMDLGVRIEPGRPNAYVTAKCVLPLISLSRTCRQRAEICDEVVKHLDRLQKASRGAASCGHHAWRVHAEVDQLVLHLRELAPISVASPAFRKAANTLAGLLPGGEAPTDVHHSALLALAEALGELKKRNAELLREGNLVIRMLNTSVVSVLLNGKSPVPFERRKSARANVPLSHTLGFLHSDEEPDHERQTKYARMLGAAAKKAIKQCEAVLEQIRLVSRIKLPRRASDEKLHAAIKVGFEQVAAVNREVGRLVSEPVELQARWCHAIANREVAYTSANNFTDFDPAELISSIAVAVRTERFTTSRQLADAVQKAVLGAQPDGSWRLMHPYFSRDGAQGIRPPAADVVWTLASALSEFPEIDVADDALFRFVDWLERTQREVRPRIEPGGAGPRNCPDRAVGWASDQMRESDRVNLLTTASAINALLAIRDLVEHRLWELCRRRFTVIKDTLPLFKMDPVDLLAPQTERLHSRLAQMSREVQTPGGKGAYSMVLHGPPGSSKTAVASALSRRMWRDTRRWKPGEHRLLRITPADFTRHGEERVESEAQLIFRLLGRLRGVTVLFDEIDDLLRRRGGERLSFLNLVVPAMLNRLQDLREVCDSQEICFLFGTNYVERIEPALMRQGRIDAIVPVTYPDHHSRRCIAERILEISTLKEGRALKRSRRVVRQRIDGLPEDLASRTAEWPWSAISAACEKIRGKLEELREGDTEDKQLAQIEEIVDTELAAHSAQSQVDLGYENRVRSQYDSQQLRQEYLYVLVSQWKPSEGQALRAFVEERIKSFGKVEHDPPAADPNERRDPGPGSENPRTAMDAMIRKKLSADLRSLPHFRSSHTQGQAF